MTPGTQEVRSTASKLPLYEGTWIEKKTNFCIYFQSL
jgi:hypothetical protein